MRPLYETTSAHLYGIMMHYTNDPQHAREGLKQVYLDVWRDRTKLPTEAGNAYIWLKAQVRRHALLIRSETNARNGHAHLAVDDMSVSSGWNGMDQEDKDLITAVYLKGIRIETLALEHGVEPAEMLQRLSKSIARLGRAQS